jgi:pilus assembly protein CpaE
MADNPAVVIVDQNPENRAELPRLLLQAGIAAVSAAGYGVEAPTAVAESRPQLILLSLEEPLTRSLQTMTTLAEVAPDTPIVVYSSLGDPATLRRAMLAGARDYLTTPLTPEALHASILAILDQEAARERRLAGDPAPPTASGMVITVFGAKGGIGKTTIATNLAAALHRETSQSVALIDMDTRFGDVAVMLDLPTDKTVTEAARAAATLDRHNVRDYLIHHPAGLSVLPAPQDPSDWEAIGPEEIERIVRVLVHTFDYVILDTPGTFNEVVGISLELATLVLLITSMDVASIKDTVMALNMLRKWSFPEEKIKLMINHSNHANSIHDVDVARALDTEIYWQVPFDLATSRAGQLGLPVVLASPRAKVAQNLAELARAIGGIRQPTVRPRRGPFGALHRVLGWS